MRDSVKLQHRFSIGIVLLVGIVCFGLERGLAAGFISCNLPRVLPVSSGLLLAYLIVPAGTLVLLGQNPLAYFRLGNWRSVSRLCLWFAIGIVVGSVWVAWRPDFQRQSGLGTALTMESLVGTFLVLTCGEFFYRGFLLLPVSSEIGWYAAMVSVVPYVLIHLGTPTVEFLGSIPFGLALAYLAVKSGSIVYGLMLHALLAILVPLVIQVSSTWR